MLSTTNIVIAVDPGPTPGVVLLEWCEKAGRWEPYRLDASRWVIPHLEIVNEIKAVAAAWSVHVVCEDWAGFAEARMPESTVETIRQIGGIRAAAHLSGSRFEAQKKNQTGAKLRKAGLLRDSKRFGDSKVRAAVGRYYEQARQWEDPYATISALGHPLQALGLGLSYILTEET